MITVEKVYMTSCKPCEEVGEILKDLQNTKDFILNEYNIEDGDFRKERKVGKRLLAKWGTTKVPLILFSIDGEVKNALYGGMQKIDRDAIESIFEALEPTSVEKEVEE